MKRAGSTRRKSDNVVDLKGTRQHVRHGTDEQKVSTVKGRPRCPQWLHKYARQEWRRIVPLLDQMGVLSKSDAMVLTQYCVLAGELRLATVGERIRLRVLKDGTKIEVNVSFSSAEHTQLRMCAMQLGLTVLARQSIKLPKGQKQNRFEGL